MTNATLQQAKHLITVFEALDSGQLQALIASGLLTDLRRCAAQLVDLTKVDRTQYQRLLGLDPTLFRVKMGGANNTDQIMAALDIAFITHITQENFPLKPSKTPWEDDIEIIDPGCSFNEREGLQFLKDANLNRPTYEHGIRLCEQHGKATPSEKKPLMIFLHEAWLDPEHHRGILCLDRGTWHRGLLHLYYPDGRFSDKCVLAGVRPRWQPQS